MKRTFPEAKIRRYLVNRRRFPQGHKKRKYWNKAIDQFQPDAR